MPNIETLLSEEIASKIKKLDEMDAGTQEYEHAVNGITKLMDRMIENDKLDSEDKHRKETQKEEKKDRLIRNIIAGVGVVLPVIVTIWGTKKSFEFEKEGTITTIMGRGFINNLLHRK